MKQRIEWRQDLKLTAVPLCFCKRKRCKLTVLIQIYMKETILDIFIDMEDVSCLSNSLDLLQKFFFDGT